MAGALGAAAGLLALAFAWGYLSGTPLLYGSPAIPMAANTTAGLLFLSLGTIAAVGRNHWPWRPFVSDSARDRLFRTFVPFTVLAVLCALAVERRLVGISDPYSVVRGGLVAIFALAAGWIASRLAAALGGAIDRARLAQHHAEIAPARKRGRPQPRPDGRPRRKLAP